MKPLEQMKKILTETGLTVLNDEGYRLLEANHMIESVDQAKVMAQILKDVVSVNYNSGYAEGRADQAFEDGKKMAQFIQSQEISNDN